jgi:hypothetical protein
LIDASRQPGHDHDPNCVPTGQQPSEEPLGPVNQNDATHHLIDTGHAALSAHDMTTAQGLPGGPAIETDGLAQQQHDHHSSQEDEVTVVADRTILTQAAELIVEPGVGPRGFNVVC